MTHDEEHEAAKRVFQAYGTDPSGLSQEALRNAWRQIARRCHPDHGGSGAAMTDLNVAYQVLSKRIHFEPSPEPKPAEPAPGKREEKSKPDNGIYTPPSPPRDSAAAQATRPEWLDGMTDGRFGAVTGVIRRQDYTDRNYIRKTMHERSRGPRESFHVQAFDGVNFTGLRINASAELTDDMVNAVAELHRAECGLHAKAVLVRSGKSDVDHPPSLWLLGSKSARLELAPDERSVNDPEFIQKLNRIINSAFGTV